MEVEVLKKKKQQALKALEKYNSLWEDVYTNCHCPGEELIRIEKYYEGGYDYHAHTECWNECTICLRKYHIKSTTHSWYG